MKYILLAVTIALAACSDHAPAQITGIGLDCSNDVIKRENPRLCADPLPPE